MVKIVDMAKIQLQNIQPLNNAPDWSISPEDKLKSQYNLDYSRYIYNQYLKGSSVYKMRPTRLFRENRDYFNSNQDTTRYKQAFIDADPQNIQSGVVKTDYDVLSDDAVNEGSRQTKLEGWHNINFQPISAMYKISNMIHGTYDNADWEIVSQCIDQTSVDQKENFKWGMVVQRDYGEWLNARRAIAGLPTKNPQFTPKDDVELEFFMSSYGYKLPLEICIEKAVKHSVEQLSGWLDIKRKLIDDWISNSICACRINTENNGSVSVKYVDPDPEKFIIQNSDYPDFRDSEYGAHIEFWPIYKIRKELLDLGKTPLEAEQQIQRAVRRYNGQIGNPTYPTDWGTGYITSNLTGRSSYSYDNIKVPVMHCQWIDNDMFTNKKTTNKFGRTQIIPLKKGQKVNETENTKVVSHNFKRKHQCSWLIDTEIVFNYGLCYPADSSLDYKVVATTSKSMVEVIKPFLDGLCMGWYKLQDAVATARPSILAFQWNALQNMQIGGSIMDPLDIIKMAMGTGVLPYMSTDERGKFNVAGGMPIQELPGGLGKLAQEAIELITQNNNWIYEYTGINPLSMGATPAPRTGKAVTEMAVGSSSVMTKPIIDACMKIKNRIANDIAPIIISYVQNDNLSNQYYTEILGVESVKLLMMAKSPIKYGMKLEAQPNDEQIQMIRQYLQQGLALGRDGVSGIEVPDAMYIEQLINDGANLKQIWMYACMLVKNNQDKKQALAIQSQQMEAEKNNQYAQLQAQIADQAAEKQHQMAIDLDNHKTDNLLKLQYAKDNTTWLKQQIDSIVQANEMEQQLQQEYLAQLQEQYGQQGQQEQPGSESEQPESADNGQQQSDSDQE